MFTHTHTSDLRVHLKIYIVAQCTETFKMILLSMNNFVTFIIFKTSFFTYLNKMATWRRIQAAVVETCVLTVLRTIAKYEIRMWVPERKYDELNKRVLLLLQQFPQWDVGRITARKYRVTRHNTNVFFTNRKNNHNNREYEIVQTNILKAKKSY